MHRMGVLRRGGMFLVLCAMGLALVMGGCSRNKKADLATTEANELRVKVAELEEALRQKDMAAAQNTQAMMDEPMNDPAPRNVRRGSSGDDAPMIRNRGGVTKAEISGDVLFASGSADVRPEARKTLDKIVAELKRDYARASIVVEGYTDSDPLVKAKAKWGTNDRLSQARADAVKKYLSSKGISSSRIETMGYGSAKPQATKAKSRRVEIIVLQ